MQQAVHPQESRSRLLMERVLLETCDGRVFKAREIAKRLHVTERTIYRYIKRLRGAGEHYVGDPGFGYQYRGGLMGEGHLVNLVSAVRTLVARLEAFGGNPPLAIVVDRDTSMRLRSLRQRLDGVFVADVEPGPRVGRLQINDGAEGSIVGVDIYEGERSGE